MNARLQAVVAEAEALLSEEDKEGLAEVIADYLADSAEPIFTPEELAHLDRVAAEPFVEADPARLAALFARRGTR